MNEDAFQITKEFKSYIANREITNSDPRFLVKGSKNVLLDYASRIVSRRGYVLFGAANTGGNGIKGSYEWDTSTAKQFPLRSYDAKLEFYWNNAWNTLKSNLRTPYLEFAKIWDNTEKIDVLLYVMGDTNTYKWSGGATRIWKTTGTTLTKQGVLTAKTTIAFVAGTPGSVAPTITDSDANFLNAGFAAGDTLYVTGSAGNSRNFTIGSVTAGVITLIMSDTLVSELAGPAVTVHNGEPTWASSRFLTTGTRSIIYNGIEYAYTGGESTDTLTGLTAFPAVTLGDPAWQTVVTLANPGAINANFKQDLIAVQLNQLILGSTKSQEIYGSANIDYTNFTITSPRAPADPFKVNMDNYCTCIIPTDNLEQTASALLFGGGTNEFFKLSYQMAQDNSNELVRMIKLKTASGSGIIAKGAIGTVKNANVYISREPTLESLGTIEAVSNKENVPLSDAIKDDFDSYDFTNAHIKYWKRSIYIALPAEGLLLIYDQQKGVWQPPQTIPISRLSIINDWLYGHSSISNETYRLFTGTNDNGIFIPQVARFAYNNGGKRDRIKNMDEFWSDGYISPNGLLNMTSYLGFAGSAGLKLMTISGGDSDIVTSIEASPTGSEPYGSVPYGGSPIEDFAGLVLGGNPLVRFYQVDTQNLVDYTESFVEYSMDTLDGQFAIVAHGNNQWDASTSAVTHKK